MPFRGVTSRGACGHFAEVIVPVVRDEFRFVGHATRLASHACGDHGSGDMRRMVAEAAGIVHLTGAAAEFLMRGAYTASVPHAQFYIFPRQGEARASASASLRSSCDSMRSASARTSSRRTCSLAYWALTTDTVRRNRTVMARKEIIRIMQDHGMVGGGRTPDSGE